MQEISFHDDILPLKEKLYRMALRITFDKAEAEDIVQDTLIKVWDKRSEWTKLDSVEAFCLTVTKNLAIDRTQKRGSRTLELEEGMDRPSTASGPHETLVTKERLALLHRLIGKLPQKQRQTMRLRDIEGKSYKEIATLLGITEEQVKVNLFRARQKVKQQFIEIEDYGL